MTILKKIETAQFLASEQDIELMAQARQNATDTTEAADGTYLKVLVALTAQELGNTTTILSRRRGKSRTKALPPAEIRQHMEAFTKVNDRCYGAVLRAIEVTDPLERNRRSNYARTAASALRGLIQAGADVRDLNVTTVTKSGLRRLRDKLAPEREVNHTMDFLIKSTSGTAEKLVADVEAVAEKDSAQALLVIHALLDRLEDLRSKVEKHEPIEHVPLLRAA